MSMEKVSILVVEEDREIRECLWELFRGGGYEVSLAENPERAFAALPEEFEEGWPDIIVLGHVPSHSSPDDLAAQLEQQRPGLLKKCSVIVFSSFRMPLPGRAGQPERHYQVCRLTTVSNLMTVVRGLASRKIASIELT